MNADFHNHQLESVHLPTVAAITYTPLALTYKKVLIYSNAIFLAILIIAYIVVGIFIEELFGYPIGIIALIVGLVLSATLLIFASKSYDYQGYVLRERDILFKSGVFFRSVIVIPFNRVQHCEIEQGPINRFFDLAVLSLYTAGGSSSDLKIPGLTMGMANSLKSFITDKVATDEEE